MRFNKWIFLLLLCALPPVALAVNTPQEMPQVKFRVNPFYPSILKAAGIEGEVSVRVFVNENGGVDKATVEKTSNKDFDDAALDAVKQWEFTPALKDGKPIKAEVIIPFSFKLNGDLKSKYEDEMKLREKAVRLLRGDTGEQMMSLIDTEAYVVIGNKMEHLRGLLSDKEKKSMLVEGPASKEISSIQKLLPSEKSGFLILRMKPSSGKHERYHTIVYSQNEAGEWIIRSWHTSAKQ